MAKFFINTWYLVQGTIAQVAYHILDDLGGPFDTTGAISAYLQVKNKDGSTLNVAASTGITMGMHTAITVWLFNLTAEQVGALPVGRLDAFIRIVYSDSEKILSYPGSLNVSKKPIY